MKRGFTLVELSIVLVIIGLLIGGILVAQSMIQTVKIQRMVSDLQQYSIALNTFKTNYKQLPGDSNYFTPAGDNDGTIFYNMNGADMVFERASIWAHLSQAKMLKDNYVYRQEVIDEFIVNNRDYTGMAPVHSATSGWQKEILYNDDPSWDGLTHYRYFETSFDGWMVWGLVVKLSDGNIYADDFNPDGTLRKIVSYVAEDGANATPCTPENVKGRDMTLGACVTTIAFDPSHEIPLLAN